MVLEALAKHDMAHGHVILLEYINFPADMSVVCRDKLVHMEKLIYDRTRLKLGEMYVSVLLKTGSAQYAIGTRFTLWAGEASEQSEITSDS